MCVDFLLDTKMQQNQGEAFANINRLFAKFK